MRLERPAQTRASPMVRVRLLLYLDVSTSERPGFVVTVCSSESEGSRSSQARRYR